MPETRYNLSSEMITSTLKYGSMRTASSVSLIRPLDTLQALPS